MFIGLHTCLLVFFSLIHFFGGICFFFGLFLCFCLRSSPPVSFIFVIICLVFFFLSTAAAAAAAASSSASVFGTQVGRRRWFFFLKCLLACLFAFPLRLNGSRPRFVACVMVLAYLALIRLLPRGRGCDGGGGGGVGGGVEKRNIREKKRGQIHTSETSSFSSVSRRRKAV